MYIGGFSQGQFSGPGRLFDFEKKTLFTGTFENGKKIFGKLSGKEECYEGEFKEDTPHGKGRLEFKMEKNDQT